MGRPLELRRHPRRHCLLVTTLLLPRWRNYLALTLIPYGLLLCADFTLRWF